jgi:hypothetical protein
MIPVVTKKSKEVDDVGFLAKSVASLSAGVIGLSASVLESFTRNYVLGPKAASRSLRRVRDQSYPSRLSPLLCLSVLTPGTPLHLKV